MRSGFLCTVSSFHPWLPQPLESSDHSPEPLTPVFSTDPSQAVFSGPLPNFARALHLSPGLPSPINHLHLSSLSTFLSTSLSGLLPHSFSVCSWPPSRHFPPLHPPDWIAGLPFLLLRSFSLSRLPTLQSPQPAEQFPNSGRDSQDKARKIRAIWEVNRNWTEVGREERGGPRWWWWGLSGPTQFRECLLPPLPLHLALKGPGP